MDASDEEIIERVKPYTQTSRERMVAMVNALRAIDAAGIKGDIVECGVWRGGNIILARKFSPDRFCWLYDTFSGMTEPGEFDRKPKGTPALAIWERKVGRGKPWCAASVDDVYAVLAKFDVDNPGKLRFVIGDVSKTLRMPNALPDRIALLRLDTDWYESTKVELEVLYPRLAVGGILIVDDYGHWEGAKKAVDEFFAGQDVSFHKIDYTGIMMVRVA